MEGTSATSSSLVSVTLGDKNPFDVSRIPEELILYIFSFFTSKELSVVSLVCKQWKHISEDPALSTNAWVKTRENLKQLCAGQKVRRRILDKEAIAHTKWTCYAPTRFILLHMHCVWMHNHTKPSTLHIWNLEKQTEEKFTIDCWNPRLWRFDETKLLITYYDTSKEPKTYDLETNKWDTLPKDFPKRWDALVTRGHLCLIARWTTTHDSNIFLWDLQKEQQIKKTRLSENFVYADIIWNESFLIFTSSSDTKRITLFDAKTFNRMGKIIPYGYDQKPVNQIYDVQLYGSVLFVFTPAEKDSGNRIGHFYTLSPEITKQTILNFDYKNSEQESHCVPQLSNYLINNLFFTVNLEIKKRKSTIKFFNLNNILNKSTSDPLGKIKVSGFVSKIEILACDRIFLRALVFDKEDNCSEKFRVYRLKERSLDKQSKTSNHTQRKSSAGD